MSGCIPGVRRRRTPPPRPPPPKYHVFIKFKLPHDMDDIENKLIADWSLEFHKKHTRLPSTFEVRLYLEQKYSGKYDDWSEEYSLSLETTRAGATLWQIGESMDDYISYRNPSPPPNINENMYYYVNKKSHCCICLNDTEGIDTVALSTCHCIYHKKCIEKSYNYSNKCPVCNSEIREVIVYDFDFNNPVDIIEL